jgi:GT2 family glycosyltransferase
MYYVRRQIHSFNREVHYTRGLVSAVIPVYADKMQTLPEALRCVGAQQYHRLEIFVISNGIHPNTFAEQGISFPANVQLVYLDKNMGAAYARNAGACRSTGEFLWFVDSDVYGIRPDCVTQALDLLGKDSTIGSLGGIIFPAPDKSYFVVGRIREEILPAGAGVTRLQEDGFVNSACLFLRRSVFHEVQGFADFIEYPFDDVDLGYKIRTAGWRCVGSESCAGKHPLHSLESSVRHEFMTWHNLMLHFAINYNGSDVLAWLKEKQKKGWRLDPPRQASTPWEHIRRLLRRTIGGGASLLWLMSRISQVHTLRKSRQALLAVLQNMARTRVPPVE